MANPVTLFNGPLTASFQPTAALTIVNKQVVLDFDLVIPGPAPVSVQWYPEFAEGDLSPSDPNARWYREVAEEDIGNGDVRMPIAIRRFTTQGADAALPAGSYRFSVQLKRTHMFVRLQIQGLGCQATVRAPFGDLAA